MLNMINKLKSVGLVLGMLVVFAGLSGCQFQPLYGNGNNLAGGQSASLSGLYIEEVDTRAGQQVRNHLIFLLNGGASPFQPTHSVKLRVNAIDTTLAGAVANLDSNQIGNTAGNVRVSVSYEIFDVGSKEIIYRGQREARASYDKTSQSFATERARRDAENRAAREVAEQLRFAIASHLNAG